LIITFINHHHDHAAVRKRREDKKKPKKIKKKVVRLRRMLSYMKVVFPFDGVFVRLAARKRIMTNQMKWFKKRS